MEQSKRVKLTMFQGVHMVCRFWHNDLNLVIEIGDEWTAIKVEVPFVTFNEYKEKFECKFQEHK